MGDHKSVIHSTMKLKFFKTGAALKTYRMESNFPDAETKDSKNYANGRAWSSPVNYAKIFIRRLKYREA